MTFLTTAFAAEILVGKSPIDVVFDVQNTWRHSNQCLESWFHFPDIEFEL